MASNKEFYNRMKEIAGIKSVNESKTETNTKTLIDYERANNGTVYGIVKENHNYFIKKALIKEGDIKVTDFIYIDGVKNKGKYQYKSIGEAEKQRNLYLRNINEAFNLGGVYFVNETTEISNPSLDVKEDFSSLIKRRINSGQKNINENREQKFKSALPKKTDAIESKKGLMSEEANLAIRKALGIISEEVMVTADSKIKDGDKVSEKKGKESPQPPINDSNAKAKADKATGTSKKDANKKPAASDSLAVNQQEDTLKEEASPLVTDDSEIIGNDSMANKVNQKHESPQAPINDGNAKAMADKATGSNGSAGSMSNNVDDYPESDSFDDKENAGDQKSDIVSEDINKGNPFETKAKLSSGSDEVTADSEEVDVDRVDDETRHENPDADYNNYNQPEKGHKEQKGTQLKTTPSKKDVIDEAADALAKLTEGNDLSTADSEIKVGLNTKNNVNITDPKLAKGTSKKMNDNPIAEGNYLDEAGEEELDAATSKLDDLDAATDAEAPTEKPMDDMGGEEAPTEEPINDMGGEEDSDSEAPADSEEDSDSEAPADSEEDSVDLVVKEIQKLYAKGNQKVSTNDIETKTAEGLLKGVITAFKDKITDMDMDGRKEMSDDIIKPDGISNDGEEAPTEEPMNNDMGGEEDSDNEEGGKEFAEVKENTKMEIHNNSKDSTFESYMESRGYSPDNLEECSSSEMTNMISGYLEDKDDDDDGVVEGIASYMDESIATELEEYGYGDLAERARPFMKEDGISYRSVEPTLSEIEMGEDDGEDMDNDGDIDHVDYLAKKDHAIEKAMGESEDEESPEVEISKSEEQETSNMGFAPVGDNLGGFVKSESSKTKSVEVDLNSGTLKMNVTEGNEKVRNYIKNRIQELAGKKKPLINENAKSNNLKKLDKLIESQWKLFGSKMLNK